MGDATLATGDRLEGFACAAVGRLQRLLGEELLAAYLIGSGALGGAVAEQSDLDLVAVCAHAPSPTAIQQLVAALTEEAMTWPVRGLEFVLYPRAAVATPSPAPRFAINLNVGRRMPLHLSTDPAAEPAHWFVIDLAILREHGVALLGPPAHQLVAPIPRAWLLAALADGLTWHAANERALHQSVLNAGRAWRYAVEGVWSSKDAAAGWALARAEDPGLIRTALAVRHGDRSQALDPAGVDRFVRDIRARVERAAARSPAARRCPPRRWVPDPDATRTGPRWRQHDRGDPRRSHRAPCGRAVDPGGPRAAAPPWRPRVPAGARAARHRSAGPGDPHPAARPGRHLPTAGLCLVRRHPGRGRPAAGCLPRRHRRLCATGRRGLQWPAHQPVEVLCHNDFAFMPLTDPANPDAPYPGPDRQARRLARLCEAYGAPSIRPADIVDAAIARLGELVAFIVDAAAAGDPAQQLVRDRGDTVIYRRDIAYLQQSRNALAQRT